ncbi:hypothetical protein QBC39DRAFT_387462 [Podospora conica]|nr:hypothetical protein QBC39DRAFT_387462 [Schizothecium conicum]
MAIAASVKKAFAFGTDTWDPTHRFETSWLLSPWILFAIRALFSFYAFFTSIFILAHECAYAPNGCASSRERFSYFTVLTYWGLAFYFLAAAVHTFTYARTGVPLLARLPRPLQALHSLFYTTITVYPFIVTVVYWATLYSGTWFPTVFDGWSNVSQHMLNSFFALFEIFVPRTSPPPVVHVLWLLVVLAGYLGVAYITHAAQGWYPYSFLDPGRANVTAYVFGILAGALVVFGVVWGLVWARRWVTEKKMGRAGKFARGRTAGDEVAMSERGVKEEVGAAEERRV